MTTQGMDGPLADKGQERRGFWPRFNILLVLPAQLTMMAVVIVPTLIILWLAITDWQPTQAIPWFEAEPVWFWNF